MFPVLSSLTTVFRGAVCEGLKLTGVSFCLEQAESWGQHFHPFLLLL
jgi:quercetin dioxygenase-like cupin family protein